VRGISEQQFEEAKKLAGALALALGTVSPEQQLFVLAMVTGGIVAARAPNMREMKRGLEAFGTLAEAQARDIRKSMETAKAPAFVQ